ncbi:MAG: type II toxin-antitoxin system VapC family toxin [Candidatus Limnocylindrales bacterium]
MPGTSLLIDTSVVLAYLAGNEPTSGLAEQLFDAFIATGRNRASLSTITVQEILVRPFRAGASAVAIAEGFLGHFADIDLVDVSYDIAREAARIRAVTGIRTPDAIILATAVVTRVDTLVTNDRAWPTRAAALGGGVGVCVLGEIPADT